MSKVFIFRFETVGGPGYLGHFLDRYGIDYQVVKVDQNQTIPTSIDGVSALVFMGGGMSANDDIQWITRTLGLIKDAQSKDIPMLGHCLGGQLISKALGGVITDSPVREIGWLPVDVVRSRSTPAWCHELPSPLEVFHWHNETFSIPQDATHIFERRACPNQGFQIGRTIALQFHLEVLPEMVTDWTNRFLDKSHVSSEYVQSAQTILKDLTKKSNASKRIAECVYGHWCGMFI